MGAIIKNPTLLSHQNMPDGLKDAIQKTKERIKKSGDKPHVSVVEQLILVDALAQFELGQFLLQHQGLNGFWTHYVLTHPWMGRQTGLNSANHPFSDLEKTILNTLPIALATQQRFQYFLKENQAVVKNGARLACVPCGLMGELLYLNYEGIAEIELLGIDLDDNALRQAQKLAEQRHLAQWSRFEQKNAWDCVYENTFDLISSTGLNIYESDDRKLLDLHQKFYRALKVGGKLVTSFLTYPPSVPEKCEWDLSKIDSQHALLQRILFVDILDSKFQYYRTSDFIQQQLEAIGFAEIKFVWDEARIFPTVTALKC